MANIDTAREGDCLASIAARHGFSDAKAIHEHPDNAELRRLRPNFNVLARGDQVVIAERTLKDAEAPTGASTRFKVKLPEVELRVRLLDDTDEPFADQRFRLVTTATTIDGTTDGDGHVRARIPAGLTSAELWLWLDDPDSETPDSGFQLQIGSLAPVSALRGVQARLTSLGYWCGAVDDRIGPRTRHALRAFPARHALTISGEPDDATRTTLVEAQGC